MKIPDDILQRLVMYCQEQEIGIAQIEHEEAGVCMIIMGRKDMSPNEVSIVCAHMLLTGVLSGGFQDDNIKRAKEEENISKDKLM